jgi:hypothetical protein
MELHLLITDIPHPFEEPQCARGLSVTERCARVFRYERVVVAAASLRCFLRVAVLLRCKAWSELAKSHASLVLR